MCKRFCEGDKFKMRELIGRVESGEEKRKEVLEGVEGIRGYLERREEVKVGDWVHDVSAFYSPFLVLVWGSAMCEQ